MRGQSLNLVIFEYVSGGGYADQKLSSSILSEAYGMLRSLVSDFKNAGHNVTTLMDSRLVEFNAPVKANKIVPVYTQNQIEKKIEELSSLVDYFYVIAPESGKILQKILQIIEDFGGLSLNSEIDAVNCVSNKMTAFEKFKQSGLKVPETVVLDTKEKTEIIRRQVKELGYPLIIKPLEGTSCGGLSKVKDENEISKAIKKVTQDSTSRQFVAQELVKGQAASACVISTGDKATALSLNKQLVNLSSPTGDSTYIGGVVPFKHSLEIEALRAAEKAVEAVNGLKGYVGVDLTLSDKEPILIEINPRLTVSYIGINRVANFNTADVITDAVTKQKLPIKNQTMGYCYFSKIKVPSWPLNVSQTYKLKDVISPPFSTSESEVYTLIASSSSTNKGAKSAFYRSKKRLLSIWR
jgi:predicted ATP-grasp superfamily ATP-dependent carboligase